MSTSLNVVSMAAVFWASLRRRATVWRRRDIRTRSSRRSPEGEDAAAAAGGGGGGGGAGAAASASRLLAAARTSSLVSRPSLPVPLIFDGSRPSSSTSRRTEGDKVR